MTVNLDQIRTDRAKGVIISNITWDALVAYASELEIQSQAAKDVFAERRRQVEVEGWTPNRDDAYEDKQLRLAAACYALAHQVKVTIPNIWPWHHTWWKPTTDRRNLVKAGALILAEIERIDRANAKG